MRICLLGGTGFVGRHLSEQLVAKRHEVIIPTRRLMAHRDLLVLPTVRLIEGDVHNPVFLRRVLEGADAAINLVGILNERGRSGRGFLRVHAELPAKLVQACAEAGVKRLLHMSALNASLDAPSHYLRTKAMGEDSVHRAAALGLKVTSFRPSVIFGPDDSFTNRFARLLKLVRFVFPLACPEAKLQPVYVEDVAHCFVAALDNSKTEGQRYELCGPRVYTLHEIVTYLARLLGLRTRIVGLGDRLSYLQAAVMEFVPGKPFSLDNYRSLQVDSVCRQGFPEIFGITPKSMESIVPGYLGTDRESRLARLRCQAGR